MRLDCYKYADRDRGGARIPKWTNHQDARILQNFLAILKQEIADTTSRQLVIHLSVILLVIA